MAPHYRNCTGLSTAFGTPLANYVRLVPILIAYRETALEILTSQQEYKPAGVWIANQTAL